MLLLLLAQAAAVAPSPPERISILAAPCPASTEQEVVVCGGIPAPRLPLPDERDEPGTVKRYPGEAASGDPGACAASQWGCQVGVDIFGMATAAVRLVGKAIDPSSCCDEPGQASNIAMLGRDAVRALKKKPDRSNRVAIDLDAPPPSTAGRLSP